MWVKLSDAVGTRMNPQESGKNPPQNVIMEGAAWQFPGGWGKWRALALFD
jgi:hypothetical protein